MMRRITAVVTLTFASLLVTAGAAMAQTSSYPVAPSPTTIVKGASGTRGDGTAFTGSSQIPFLTLMIVALVVAGVAALFVDRKVGILPVVDDAERLVGIVSYTDVLRAVLGPKSQAN